MYTEKNENNIPDTRRENVKKDCGYKDKNLNIKASK